MPRQAFDKNRQVLPRLEKENNTYVEKYNKFLFVFFFETKKLCRSLNVLSFTSAHVQRIVKRVIGKRDVGAPLTVHILNLGY